jgi:opacity protein-like surface antigen
MSIDSMSSLRALRRRLTIVATLLVMLGSSAHADTDPDAKANTDANAANTPASIWSLSGFGTLGVVHSTERRADFTSGVFEKNGAGYTRALSPGVDSRLGAQLMANFTPRFSAILQGVAQQNSDGSYTPHLEWANLKYAFTADASVRVGRIVLPSLLVSDSRAIGYTYPQARPPVEVYSIIPVTSSDGLDASYRLHFGEAANTIVGSFGSTRFSVPGFGTLGARRVWVIADTVEYGAATVHIAYEQGSIVRYPATLDALFTAFQSFGPQGELLSAKYDPERKLAQVVTLGATYDPGDWFVMAEALKRETHSFAGASTAWYASGGHRFGAYTPYLTYSELRSNSSRSDPGLTISNLPPYLAAPAASLNAALNSTLALIQVQSTVAAGARWDFMKNVDLTVQYSRTHLGAGSAGLLVNTQPGFQPGRSFNLLSLTVDFVW